VGYDTDCTAAFAPGTNSDPVWSYLGPCQARATKSSPGECSPSNPSPPGLCDLAEPVGCCASPSSSSSSSSVSCPSCDGWTTTGDCWDDGLCFPVYPGIPAYFTVTCNIITITGTNFSASGPIGVGNQALWTATAYGLPTTVVLVQSICYDSVLACTVDLITSGCSWHLST
jgi:hypothetical protein